MRALMHWWDVSLVKKKGGRKAEGEERGIDIKWHGSLVLFLLDHTENIKCVPVTVYHVQMRLIGTVMH